MEIRELRLGNLIRQKGLGTKHYINDVVKVDLEFFEDISTSYNAECISMYEPIPLTDKWLVNFGFNVKNSSAYKTAYSANFLSVDKNKFKEQYDCYAGYKVDELYITTIKYVHELQNLYFALTKNELQLK